VKLIEIEKSFWKSNSPLKIASFQTIRIPPEAPMDGRYANLLNLLGQNFLRYWWSKDCLLVSCSQMMSQPHSSILFDKADHFFSELMPLMFQFKIF
jgi:hypothetical protein